MNSDRTAVESTPIETPATSVSASTPGQRFGGSRFRALKHRNFQLFIGGQLVSLIGTWMQTTAQLWLVYRLSISAGLSPSAAAARLGIFGFANQIPMLVLASVGGWVGDRYSKHRGVIAT